MNQNNDYLLEEFFKNSERWTRAIGKGVDKDIRRAELLKLAKPEGRAAIYTMIKEGRYKISPPHTAKIPKDTPGEFRTVYVNEPIDRVLLSVANDMLFDLMPEMVHPRCKSYQKGIGCGKVVQEISKRICSTRGDVVGWKSDLSKYFDSVPIRYIDKAFDMVEAKFGKSAIIDVIRDYYHSDIYLDEDLNVCQSYQSLKQGCAVAAWLADCILYHIDDELSKMDGDYVRYSDDTLFVGNDYMKAMEFMESALAEMEMKLNPKKVEYLTWDRWFKFLGYSIKGQDISLSSSRIKKFQKEIMARTIKSKGSYAKALNSVNRFLYKGDGKHSWATQVLPVINVREDIDTLNEFVMDCLRAVQTGRTRVGGLGYVVSSKVGCIDRGRGRHVKSNRERTPERLDGYLSIGTAYNALHTTRDVFEALIRSL